jgi:hypothetical protein
MSKVEPTTGNREVKVNASHLKNFYKKFTLKELGRDLEFSPSNSSSPREEYC